MTTVEVLSHACLLVSTDSHKIIVDPWLVGSCYWRSWWNYPKPVVEDGLLDSVDAVFLSHIHWDHWHGPTLKKFFKGVPIYVGDDPNDRSIRDLKAIGYDSINVVRHGSTACVGDISVSFYNFGTLLNDSALIIETCDTRILNANDAKIAGASLKHLVKKHGPFDFAFRSHSSANSRICYQTVSGDGAQVDDREHYFRSFVLFMNAVQPRYAVPFASNHCHLLDEAFHFNKYVSNPNELREFVATNCESDWEFKMLLPGSRWSSQDGFELRNQDAFDSYEQKLLEYQNLKKSRLQHYEEREERVALSDSLLNRFRAMLLRSGGLGALRAILFKLTKPSGVALHYSWNGRDLVALDDSEFCCESGVAVVTIPVAVFRDAVIKNMFHHAAISKRCSYLAWDDQDLRHLQRCMARLERLELLGDSYMFWPRWAVRQVRRWRDVLVYVQAIYYRVGRRLPLYLVEEVILKRHSGVK